MSIYVISDYHFDDVWIKKTLRDFDSIENMNKTLLENAHKTISPEDTFVFFGDIIGKDGTKGQAWEWYSKLPAIDIWIVGNHDPFEASNYENLPLPLKREWRTNHRGYTFTGRHRPGNLPERTSSLEWGIYGHKHTNHKKTYPFLDQSNQRVNISAGLINYCPISLDTLVDLIETGNSYITRPPINSIKGL